MELPGREFWVGLATGLVVAGAFGVYALNQQVRLSHHFSAFNLPARASHLSALRVRYEAGEFDRAEHYHRRIALSWVEMARFHQCVAESRWALGGSTFHQCELEFSKQVPADWEIPGLEHARERFERQQAARPRSTEETS